MTTVRHFLVSAAVLIALATALLATTASAAPGVDAGVKGQRGFWNSCAIQLQFPMALNGDRVVKLVRAEAPVNPPNAASADLVNRIVGIYAVGCGPALDTYVRVRVGATNYAWYRDVVTLNVGV